MRGKRAKILRKVAIAMSDNASDNRPIRVHGTVMFPNGTRRREYQRIKKAWTRNLPLNQSY